MLSRMSGAIGAVLVACALMAGACGDDDNSDSGASTGSTSKTSTGSGSSAAGLDGKAVAFVQTAPNPYYDLQGGAVKAAAKKLGGSADVLVSNFDPTTERANVQDAITNGVDGVILEPTSAASTRSSLRLLDKAGIPAVVLYGYDPAIEEMAAGFLQTEYAGTGGAAGEALKAALPDGDVAVITGTQGRGDAEGMTEGFKAALGDSSRVVEVVDGNWDRQTAFKAAQDIITAHPDLKGLFAHNEPMAAGAIEALGSKAKGIKIVSQNGSPEGLKLIEAGTLTATSAWSPAIEGAMATQFLAKVINGDQPEQKLCLVPFVTVTKDNIDESPPWDTSESTIDEGLQTRCAQKTAPR